MGAVLHGSRRLPRRVGRVRIPPPVLMTFTIRDEQRRKALEALITTRAVQHRRNADASGDAERLRCALSWQAPGRELRGAPVTDAPWSLIVVCLNIW